MAPSQLAIPVKHKFTYMTTNTTEMLISSMEKNSDIMPARLKEGQNALDKSQCHPITKTIRARTV